MRSELISPFRCVWMRGHSPEHRRYGLDAATSTSFDPGQSSLDIETCCFVNWLGVLLVCRLKRRFVFGILACCMSAPDRTWPAKVSANMSTDRNASREDWWSMGHPEQSSTVDAGSERYQ